MSSKKVQEMRKAAAAENRLLQSSANARNREAESSRRNAALFKPITDSISENTITSTQMKYMMDAFLATMKK